MASKLKTFSLAFFFAALFTISHFLIWSIFNQASLLIDAPKVIKGFSYSGFQQDQSPLEKIFPSTAELANDLKLLKPLTSNIRVYDSLQNTEVFALSSTFKIKVTAGVWLDGDLNANRRQIDALKEQIKRYSNIERIIVGNEALLREDLTVSQVISYLDELKQQTKLPISTAEPWHVWLKHPELVKHVNFIAVQLLPYHEGIPIEKALDYAMYRYQELISTYPRKKILISEIGWPSNGPTINGAVASQINQAKFVREFLALSTQQNLDYFLIEAFDQPWKTSIEGWGGPYWGMFDANRIQKYSLQGTVSHDDRWIIKALWSSLIAFVPILLIAYRFNHWRLGGKLSLAALIQVSITTLVLAWNLPKDYYYSLTDFLVLIGLIIAIMMTSAVLVIYGLEFSEAMFKGKWRRNYSRLPALPSEKELFVSIHLACYNEPSEMVIMTIDSLAKLKYTNYEVIVVDNNTTDESKWKPVEAYMAKMPSNFKFFHLPKWPGFKAGALNFALKQTNPSAQVIGVVDADYVVAHDWLSDLVPHFLDTTVAVVQAPQAHRDWENNYFQRMTNWEFEGFFRIGMHHRHERNALIQHGTMTLVRHQALLDSGSWSEWCICEDTELGLRLLEDGYELRYVDDTFGRGLTPSNFNALKSQRFRWAFGAMQILKHHLPRLVGKSPLNFGQRYHFLTGWFGWLGDALQLIFALGSITWTVAMLLSPKEFSLPVTLMIVTVTSFLLIKAAMGPILYRKTMNCRWVDILGASIVSLGISHAIAKGVIWGLIKKEGVFKVTAKGKVFGKESRLQMLEPIKEEVLFTVALLACSIAMLVSRGFNNVDAQIWVVLLCLQSLPYLSAIISQIVFLKDKK